VLGNNIGNYRHLIDELSSRGNKGEEKTMNNGGGLSFIIFVSIYNK
jgi:hypothetical protein